MLLYLRNIYLNFRQRDKHSAYSDEGNGPPILAYNVNKIITEIIKISTVSIAAEEQNMGQCVYMIGGFA